MLYRVKNKISCDVAFVKCSCFALGNEDIEIVETDCLFIYKVDENKWPYNEIVPDFDLTVDCVDFDQWLKNSFLR